MYVVGEYSKLYWLAINGLIKSGHAELVSKIDRWSRYTCGHRQSSYLY